MLFVCTPSYIIYIISIHTEREREQKERKRETTCRRIANYSRVKESYQRRPWVMPSKRIRSFPALLCQRCFKSSILNSLLSSCSFLAQLRWLPKTATDCEQNSGISRNSAVLQVKCGKLLQIPLVGFTSVFAAMKCLHSIGPACPSIPCHPLSDRFVQTLQGPLQPLQRDR